MRKYHIIDALSHFANITDHKEIACKQLVSVCFRKFSILLACIVQELSYFVRSQVLQRASEARKALDFLNLLNDGSDSAVVSNVTGERFDWGQFRGRLQLDTAAIMGHSFGGATTIQALSEDSRFK